MASVLSKNDMLAQYEISKKYQQQMMMAVYRYEQKKYVLEELTFCKLMFLSRTSLELVYPNLRKHPMLLPFYQIKRWFRIFNPQKRKRITDLTTARNSVTKNETDSVANLLERLELK